MAQRSISETTRRGRERLKAVREERREARRQEREALDRMLGGRSFVGRPRRNLKRSTFMPGHHGQK
jgi:hypothetical protein